MTKKQKKKNIKRLFIYSLILYETPDFNSSNNKNLVSHRFILKILSSIYFLLLYITKKFSKCLLYKTISDVSFIFYFSR